MTHWNTQISEKEVLYRIINIEMFVNELYR